MDYARLRAVFGRGKTFSHGLGHSRRFGAALVTSAFPSRAEVICDQANVVDALEYPRDFRAPFAESARCWNAQLVEPLPVFPEKQTFSQADGMSQTCQLRTSWEP